MFISSTAVLLLSLVSAVSALGSDYLDATPSTVYEASELSPQNMDFDSSNNMFVAHSGWYNDQLVHYYKFRIYAPGTYPEVVVPGGTSAQVPLQKIYFTSTTGDFNGVVGSPIVEYHHTDGVVYSDFMTVSFVTVPADYEADTFKSVADIQEAAADQITDTDIVLNIPIVPTGSTLQHPIEKGTTAAPIDPTTAWYKGVPVQTFVFEVTDDQAADYFASTRTSTDITTSAERAKDQDYAITTTPFASTELVSAIPIWHVNQFSKGVVEGENGGGPNPAGMRNVINLDRGDAGYSPLWNVLWATEMPINYSADEFRNANQGTTANGFEFFTTPMYVNCPDIGPLGPVTEKDVMFQPDIVLEAQTDSFVIIGSDKTLILTPDMEVSFVINGETIATTTTNMMGGYEYTLMASDIGEDVAKVEVVANGEVIRTIEVLQSGSAAGTTFVGLWMSSVMVVLAATMMI